MPITSGYITITDSRLKYETKCACSQAYIPEDGAIAYSIVVQVQSKNANFYIRKIDGTKPEDGTFISIDAIFFNN